MKSVYFLLRGALIGTELALGALVAPTIFYPQSILGDGVLTHFQSGKLMATIFVKFNYALLAVSVLIALCELASFRSSVKFAAKFSMGMLCAINLALALSFVFYFTPFVMDAQAAGEAATQTAEFAQMHAASEWTMKLMLFAQLALFFIKFKTAEK